MHVRLTKHFGKDGKEPNKSHEFAREKEDKRLCWL
jgi:hypothetical protein